MSIRSDVALALKHHVYTGLSKESKDFLSNDFEKCETTAEGVLFHVTNIKWYYDEDEDIRRLYFEGERLCIRCATRPSASVSWPFWREAGGPGPRRTSRTT